ncbi:MAG TPA: hypothetical protein VNV43_01485 [Candidatus Acidoferrales bacterium]|nr:hypothetical protein [Candidatus Acidoferrales bacterium]
MDSAESDHVTVEQQHDELLDRIRDFHTEVDALVGPISPEQGAELRKRYQELAAENERLNNLRMALN